MSAKVTTQSLYVAECIECGWWSEAYEEESAAEAVMNYHNTEHHGDLS